MREDKHIESGSSLGSKLHADPNNHHEYIIGRAISLNNSLNEPSRVGNILQNKSSPRTLRLLFKKFILLVFSGMILALKLYRK